MYCKAPNNADTMLKKKVWKLNLSGELEHATVQGSTERNGQLRYTFHFTQSKSVNYFVMSQIYWKFADQKDIENTVSLWFLHDQTILLSLTFGSLVLLLDLFIRSIWSILLVHVPMLVLIPNGRRGPVNSRIKRSLLVSRA